MISLPPLSTLFPYTTLFRSIPIQHLTDGLHNSRSGFMKRQGLGEDLTNGKICGPPPLHPPVLRHHSAQERSEEHTSELQSHSDLVCRLLLEKKKTKTKKRTSSSSSSTPTPSASTSSGWPSSRRAQSAALGVP